MGKVRSSRSNRIPIGPKRKIALACSGGGSKAGAFHLGVALALQEQGFKFTGGLKSANENYKPGPMEISTYVGSSAGSIISSLLASGYSLENIFNSFLSREPVDPIDRHPKVLPRLTYQKMFRLRTEVATEQLKNIFQIRETIANLVRGNWDKLIDLRWIRMTGLFSTSGIEQYLREEVLPSNRFEDFLPDLFIVGTQLNHSTKVIFGRYRLEPPPHDPTCQFINDVSVSDACAASTALPFVFAPYQIKHGDRILHYIDGEIRDTLSTHVAVDSGADLVIASYTHQPYHFSREIGSLTEIGLPSILIQSIYLLIEQKINTHIHSKKIQHQAISAVSAYCKQQGLAEEHRKRICEILESELHHRMEVDTIYIHPNPDDHQMFFKEHFSLAPGKMTEVVKSGFRAAIDAIRRYEFADRPQRNRARTSSL